MPEARLVRFSDLHPAHNPEGYFYNLLLKFVIVRDEAQLISAKNADGSYFTECYVRGLITSDEVGPEVVVHDNRFKQYSRVSSAIIHQYFSPGDWQRL